MAASAFHDSRVTAATWGESPDAMSSDDLFADINWPEDEWDSLLEDSQSPSSGSIGSGKDGNGCLMMSSDTPPHTDSSQSTGGSPQDVSNGNAVSKSSAGCRFSREARSILRTWFNEHKDNPYPTAEEKNELAAKTHLKNSQISLWLVNTRRRYRSRKHRDGGVPTIPPTMLLQAAGPNPNESGDAAAMVARQRLQRPFKELNPMDRWKVTPIEHEPAAKPVILGTVANAPPLSFDPYTVQYRHVGSRFDSDLQSGACLSHNESFWGDSLASYETGLTNSGSSISDGTAYSYPLYSVSSYPAFISSPSVISHDRRRRRGHTVKQHARPAAAESVATATAGPPAKDRPFQCTFCVYATFATKHDWQRHEKSQHLTLESWTCCLTEPTLTSASTGGEPTCAFCGKPSPSPTHLEQVHNLSACSSKSLSERTFYRKDHFQQHLRLTHDARFSAGMQAWKTELKEVKSRCGFCDARFDTWARRTEHLAAHFKCRAQMRDWVGGWGLEDRVLAVVEGVDVSRGGPIGRNEVMAMAPPPVPQMVYSLSGPGGDGGGSGVHGYGVPKMTGIPPIEDFDHFLDMAAEMDGATTAATGVLGLDDMVVSDWVDFGA